MSSNDKIYKMILLGESGVGKTSILKKFETGEYDPHIYCSQVTNFIRKDIKLPDNNSRILDIWDTPGQEKYRSIIKIFYKGANAFVLVYDPTNEPSFNELRIFWYNEVKHINSVIFVVANKCDSDEKVVKDEEGKEFAESIGAIFVSVSAKDNIGISNLFEQIAQNIHNKN